MPSKFGGIPIDEEPSKSRFGGIPLESESAISQPEISEDELIRQQIIQSARRGTGERLADIASIAPSAIGELGKVAVGGISGELRNITKPGVRAASMIEGAGRAGYDILDLARRSGNVTPESLGRIAEGVGSQKEPYSLTNLLGEAIKTGFNLGRGITGNEEQPIEKIVEGGVRGAGSIFEGLAGAPTRVIQSIGKEVLTPKDLSEQEIQRLIDFEKENRAFQQERESGVVKSLRGIADPELAEAYSYLADPQFAAEAALAKTGLKTGIKAIQEAELKAPALIKKPKQALLADALKIPDNDKIGLKNLDKGKYAEIIPTLGKYFTPGTGAAGLENATKAFVSEQKSKFVPIFNNVSPGIYVDKDQIIKNLDRRLREGEGLLNGEKIVDDTKRNLIIKRVSGELDSLKESNILDFAEKKNQEIFNFIHKLDPRASPDLNLARTALRDEYSSIIKRAIGDAGYNPDIYSKTGLVSDIGSRIELERLKAGRDTQEALGSGMLDDFISGKRTVPIGTTKTATAGTLGKILSPLGGSPSNLLDKKINKIFGGENDLLKRQLAPDIPGIEGRAESLGRRLNEKVSATPPDLQKYLERQKAVKALERKERGASYRAENERQRALKQELLERQQARRAELEKYAATPEELAEGGSAEKILSDMEKQRIIQSVTSGLPEEVANAIEQNILNEFKLREALRSGASF